MGPFHGSVNHGPKGPRDEQDEQMNFPYGQSKAIYGIAWQFPVGLCRRNLICSCGKPKQSQYVQFFCRIPIKFADSQNYAVFHGNPQTSADFRGISVGFQEIGQARFCTIIQVLHMLPFRTGIRELQFKRWGGG